MVEHFGLWNGRHDCSGGVEPIWICVCGDIRLFLNAMSYLAIIAILQDLPQLIEAIKLIEVHRLIINLLDLQGILGELAQQTNRHLTVLLNARDEGIQAVHGLQIHVTRELLKEFIDGPQRGFMFVLRRLPNLVDHSNYYDYATNVPWNRLFLHKKIAMSVALLMSSECSVSPIRTFSRIWFSLIHVTNSSRVMEGRIFIYTPSRRSASSFMSIKALTRFSRYCVFRNFRAIVSTIRSTNCDLCS